MRDVPGRTTILTASGTSSWPHMHQPSQHPYVAWATIMTISQMRRQAQGSNGPMVTVTQQKDGTQTCALVPGERVRSQSWSLSGSLRVFIQMKVMILTSQGCASQNEIRQIRSLAYIRCSDVPGRPSPVPLTYLGILSTNAFVQTLFGHHF